MPKSLKILLAIFFTIIMLFGFTEIFNMVSGNWHQQLMPNLNGRRFNDITFIDSLTGFAITDRLYAPDTSYILKTTDGGDSWVISRRETSKDSRFTKVKFLNQNTGFVSGHINISFFLKTTNGGTNWFYINAPYNTNGEDISVLNEDTIWAAQSGYTYGGVFRTTNGGLNWTQQFSGGNQNPNKIYMYNSRIGFIGNNGTTPSIYKTTNGGFNWSLVYNKGFYDIFFSDSLTGWAAYDSVRKTSDGGVNWLTEIVPGGGNIYVPQIIKFSAINKDTIWGFGEIMRPSGTENRGMISRTTNGGDNWLYQLPDTSIHISRYTYGTFINKLNGWAYSPIEGGIHTINGGDPIFLIGIQQISNNIPKDFKLFQNYPNPFNPITNIKYQIINNIKNENSNVKLIVYDNGGREVITLVDQQQHAGTYQVDFSGGNYSSGIYFYQLTADNRLLDTKKMVLLK